MNWRGFFADLSISIGIGLIVGAVSTLVLAFTLGAAVERIDGPKAGHPIPTWIAHGCEGAGGDLWAMDVSAFPTSCKVIERNQ